MNLNQAWPLLLALSCGYLLGCLSPAYFLARWLKKVDIREMGTKNAGTVNTYHVLGLFPAVITGLIDVSKGLIAMFIVSSITGSSGFGLVAGAAAVVGHVFPFYLRWRGGQGVATATGMMLYFLGRFYLNRQLPALSLVFLFLAVLSFAWISRQGEFVGLFILPSLMFLVVIFLPLSVEQLFLLLIFAYILSINILNIWKHRLWRLAELARQEIIGWRIYLRPVALFLVWLIFNWRKKLFLTLVGSVTMFFLLPDLLRLASTRVNRFFFFSLRRLYKEKELRRFSSISLFLLAIFLTTLVFEKNIAAPALCFLITGDFFSKIYGLRFGRQPLFEKTVQGSLAHFNACLMAGYLIHPLINLSLPVLILGAAVASVAEFLPLGVDDNLAVPLLSASTIYVTFLF